MWSFAHCSIDVCVANIHNKNRPNHIMETRHLQRLIDDIPQIQDNPWIAIPQISVNFRNVIPFLSCINNAIFFT